MLEEKKCRDCGKLILVIEGTEPQKDGPGCTGMAIHSVDANNREWFIGWICNECAVKKAMSNEETACAWWTATDSGECIEILYLKEKVSISPK
jgi:hypothetical protein